MDAQNIVENYLISQGFEDLKGYEGLYKISKTEIWSCWYKKTMTLQENEGYLCINLRDKDHNRHKCYFHRLLAIQYIPNPDNLPEIDHIDRNRQNNSLDNLRWVGKEIQNNNKSNNIANLTEEQQTDRITDIREYKRQWAESDRRAKGIAPREKVLTADPKEYFRKKQAEYRANMTAEEKEEHLAQRRANRKPLTEEQKEKARQRAKKQREDKKQTI